MRSEQGSDCSSLYFMKNSSLDPKNILLWDQRVVKMHLFFTRKMMVGLKFLLVIHIPQGMEVSMSTDVFTHSYKIHAYKYEYKNIGGQPIDMDKQCLVG